MIALDYFNKGLNVLPIRRHDHPNATGSTKLPYIKWKRFSTERQTEKEVINSFKKFPGARIGAVCGAVSGIAIIDVDSEEGLKLFFKKTKNISKIVTLTGKGYHFWYKHPGVNIPSKRIYKDIDVKADGGTIMLPPSEYDEDIKYRWKDCNSTFLNTELPDFPMDILPDTEGQRISRVSLYRMGCVSGERNEGAAVMAGEFLRRMSDEKKALKALFKWNDKNDPPLGSVEIETVFNSICKLERGQITKENLAKERDKLESEQNALCVDIESISDSLGIELACTYVRKPIKGEMILVMETFNGEVIQTKPSIVLDPMKLRSVVADFTGVIIYKINKKFFDPIAQSLIKLANRDIRSLDYKHSELRKYINIFEEIAENADLYNRSDLMAYEPYIENENIYFPIKWMVAELKKIGDNKTNLEQLITDLINIECKETVYKTKDLTKYRVWLVNIKELIKKGMKYDNSSPTRR